MAELDGRGAGQGVPVFARDGGVGEEAQQRPHPLAGGGAAAVKAQVVPDHLVQAVGGRIAVANQREDLGLGLGDHGGQVDARRNLAGHEPMIPTPLEAAIIGVRQGRPRDRNVRAWSGRKV